MKNNTGKPHPKMNHLWFLCCLLSTKTMLTVSSLVATGSEEKNASTLGGLLQKMSDFSRREQENPHNRDWVSVFSPNGHSKLDSPSEQQTLWLSNVSRSEGRNLGTPIWLPKLSDRPQHKLGIPLLLRNFSLAAQEEMGTRVWSQLARTAADVFLLQNVIGNINTRLDHSNVIMIITADSTREPVKEFMMTVRQLRPETLYLQIDFNSADIAPSNLMNTLNRFQEIHSINSVLVFSENKQFIVDFLANVSTFTDFKWTRFLHATEWTVVTSCQTDLLCELKRADIHTDFLSLIYKPNNQSVAVAQKSRTESLRRRTYLVFNDTESSSYEKEKLKTSGKIRKNAMLYLEAQKSVMAGMHVPVAMLSINESKLLWTMTSGNRTTIDGYCARLLELLSTQLNFTYTTVTVDDGGYFGDVDENNTGNGITGQLARREAALSTMPLSISGNRSKIIDYILIPTLHDRHYIVYRLPKQEDYLDTTYIKIIKTEYLLQMMGPVLVIGFLGLLVHLATRSCTVTVPGRITRSDLKQLYTFPKHVFFFTENVYSGQTGRVLRGSWSLFCLILGSAYSAYLVTSFTTKPEELVISNFEQLLAQRDYKIGMKKSSSVLTMYFKSKSSNLTIQRVWEKVQNFNKTDPSILDSDIYSQTRKVLAGSYVLIADVVLDFIGHPYFFAKYPDIRRYEVDVQGSLAASYVAIPKNAFYKDDLYLTLSRFSELGHIVYLQREYLPSYLNPAGNAKRHNEETTAVNCVRILLPIYVTLAAFAIGTACLAVEILYAKWTIK